MKRTSLKKRILAVVSAMLLVCSMAITVFASPSAARTTTVYNHSYTYYSSISTASDGLKCTQ